MKGVSSIKFKSEEYCSDIDCTNLQLIKKFRKLEEIVLKNKKLLEKKLKACGEYDYLNVLTAKLAYEFAKEEKQVLLNEMIKRGLIPEYPKRA